MVIFQPKGGDMYIKGIFIIFFNKGRGKSWDLHNKLEVNMKFDQKALSIEILGF